MKTQDIKNMGLAYLQVLDEALKGKQHKLDMDKDGDIDAKDFAHMRAKKKKGMDEEDVVINPKMKDKKKAGAENGEMAAEAKVDEISTDLAKKAFYQRKSQAFDAAHRGDRKLANKLADKKNKTKAYINKREEVEQVDELKKSTLGSYAKKASADAASRASDAMDKSKSGDHEGFGKQFTKSRSRLKGAQKAIDKLAKEETTEWPVYARIKENRASHTKSATEPEAMDSKASKGEKDFKAMHKVDMQPAELEDKGHDDASKAGRVTKKAPARNGDNPAGDKIQTPVDTTKG